jgi:hypothetical protein
LAGSCKTGGYALDDQVAFVGSAVVIVESFLELTVEFVLEVLHAGPVGARVGGFLETCSSTQYVVAA